MGNRFGQYFGTTGKLVKFKHADRAVPHHRTGSFEQLGQSSGRFRADVQNHVVFGNVGNVFHHSFRIGGKGFSDNHIGRQRNRAAFGRHFCHDFFGFFHQIVFGQRFADGFAFCQQECVSNAAADDQLVDFVGQRFKDGQFGRHFATGNDGNHRMSRLLQGFAQSVEFARHQHAGAGNRCGLGNSFSRSLGAVGGTERVIDEYVAQRSVGFAQLQVVFLLAFVDAHVLQHYDITGVQSRFVFTPVVQYFHVFAQQFAQMRGNRRYIVFRMEFAFGRTAEVGHHDHRRTVVQAVFDGCERSTDTGVIADVAVFERYVHIGADQNGFALNILFGQFQKCHDDSFVMVGNGNVWDYPRMRRDGKDWQRPRLM